MDPREWTDFVTRLDLPPGTLVDNDADTLWVKRPGQDWELLDVFEMPK